MSDAAAMVAFLEARLDEEEAAAKGPPGWKLEHWSAVHYKTSASLREWRVDAEPRCITDQVARGDAEHIARYDPARVLREVEAKRAVVDLYKRTRAILDDFGARMERREHISATASGDYLAAQRELAVLGLVLRHHVAVYDADPGYDPAWAPV